MKIEVNDVAFHLAVLGWLAGTVLSQGWLTLVAVIFPPYAWYLTMERVMQAAGLVGA